MTQPLAWRERPLQSRIDAELAVIAEKHVRIALAIENIWGHPECLDYINSLVVSGYEDGKQRQGFSAEVLDALISLTFLHEDEP